MSAPFQVGGEVEPPYFIGRDDVLSEVLRGISSLSQNYLIVGPRRTGKSSLLKNVEMRLVKRKDILVININCMEVTTYLELLKLVTENLLSSYERRHKAKGFVEVFKKSLTDSIINVMHRIEKIGGSVQNVVEGYISFRERQIDEHELARKTFDFITEFAMEKNVKIVVIFDEFQRTADFDGYLFNLLKSKTDRAKAVRYIFSGSSLSILQKVFLQPNSPLYLMATRINIGPLEVTDIKKFISKRLAEFNMKIEEEAINSICELTSGIPFYFQKLGDICYRNAIMNKKKTIKNKDVILGFNEMLAEFDSEFEMRFEHSFSNKQQRILKALSTKESMRVSEIAYAMDLSVNELGKDIKLLRDSLTLNRIERGRYELVDGVFRAWLSKGYKNI
ncbi:MAG: ATP-binding protein [Thermoplasmata archaeon]|nr:MAG: ATP-binding protein [Thermoplasmata archaeon]